MCLNSKRASGGRCVLSIGISGYLPRGELEVYNKKRNMMWETLDLLGPRSINKYEPHGDRFSYTISLRDWLIRDKLNLLAPRW